MEERMLRPSILSLFLLAGSMAGLGAQAQVPDTHRKPKHHYYKLIDMGTLGGPQSIVFEVATRSLNNRGVFTGCADTPKFDQKVPQNSYFSYPDSEFDPYVQHVFLWKSGEVTDLGALPEGTSSCTQWISDKGVIVGGSTNGTIDPLAGYAEVNAVLWKDGQINLLGTFGGNQSLATSVNDKGQVVGFASNIIPDAFAMSVFAFGATQVHAFLWQDGSMTDLGTLGGLDSSAFVVNERGQISGQSTTDSVINPNTGSPQVDPFLWDNGKMIDLGTLGGALGFPLGMNNRGQVVGDSDLAGDISFHAFLWDHGSMKDLGTLGGSRSEARWINERGEVAGWALLSGDSVVHAALWKDGEIIDLGTLPGSPCSYANGVNSLGQVLGAGQQCPNKAPRVAFLWENGEMVDLNSLVLQDSNKSRIFLWSANNANDRGEIVADGFLPTGENHAALLIPCDENHPDIDGCDYALAVSPEGSRLPVKTPSNGQGVTSPTAKLPNSFSRTQKQHGRLGGLTSN